MIADAIRRASQRISVKMGVPCRGAGLGVPEEFADNRQELAAKGLAKKAAVPAKLPAKPKPPQVPDPIGARRSRHAMPREQRKASEWQRSNSASGRSESGGKASRRSSARSPTPSSVLVVGEHWQWRELDAFLVQRLRVTG
jgi:hypothetical protein